MILSTPERIYHAWRAMLSARLALGFLSPAWIQAHAYDRDGDGS